MIEKSHQKENRFIPVDTEMNLIIQQKCREQDFSLIASKKTSTDPEYNFLAIVLIKRDNINHPYVTYCFNSEINGFVSGKYFENLEEALADFEVRL